ncbi:unnamed protein product [Paramecium octaurelia]|uniref:Uncharacterized protein n=1 Tax=Paramecium octaurelia TaxID=43137 RepID=A0A8S1S3C8_PAROT|nr:unnamed protein product [Paramecium octaurelia]
MDLTSGNKPKNLQSIFYYHCEFQRTRHFKQSKQSMRLMGSPNLLNLILSP